MVIIMIEMALVIILVVLLFMSIGYSSSRIIYKDVSVLKLQSASENGNKKASKALFIRNNYLLHLPTFIFGNVLTNILFAFIGYMLFRRLFDNNIELYSILIIFPIMVILGEIVPKTIASRYYVSVAKYLANLIYFSHIIFTPFTIFLRKLLKNVEIENEEDEDEDEEDYSGDELLELIDEIEEEGFIDDDTKELVASAIEFKDTVAEEIMTPRVDIFSFDINDNIKNILKEKELFTYSRILFYDETIDNIIGIVSSRKLILSLLTEKRTNPRDFLVPPIYVPKGMSSINILKKIKETQTHIVIVIDEFGGTLGIITLEDLLEEIVGEIWDEMDVVEVEFKQKSDGSYIANGDMNLDDLFELIEYDNENYECAYSSVAGWCLEMLDDFPKVGNTFDFDKYQIVITKVKGYRVEEIKILKINNKN